MLWKVPLPGKGCSTPVVWDRRIFLTAPVDGQDAVLALDWDGKELWRRALGAETPGKQRKLSSGCNPSPVTDGRSVFAFFNSGTLAALDAEGGKVRWQTNIVAAYGPEKLYWDRGGTPSPVLRSRAFRRGHRSCGCPGSHRMPSRFPPFAPGPNTQLTA